jgi:hypothetical protein
MFINLCDCTNLRRLHFRSIRLAFDYVRDTVISNNLWARKVVSQISSQDIEVVSFHLATFQTFDWVGVAEFLAQPQFNKLQRLEVVEPSLQGSHSGGMSFRQKYLRGGPLSVFSSRGLLHFSCAS